MTTQEKIARSKLSILELAEYLKNVSQACRINGVSRQHFYDIKKAMSYLLTNKLIDYADWIKTRTDIANERKIENRINQRMCLLPKRLCLLVHQMGIP